MARKFKRNYRLFVDTRSAVALNQAGPQLPGANTVGSVQIQPPFTIAFDIRRQALATANSGTISIYNLGPATRTLIHKDQWETDLILGCQLWAGYGEFTVPPIQEVFNGILTTQEQVAAQNEALQLFPRIFSGQILRAFSYRNGVDFMTQLTVLDGGTALVNSVFNRTYAAGTLNRDILLDLMGELKPTVTIGALGSFPGALLKSNTFRGPPLDILQSLTGGAFHIDNGRAYCLGPNEVLEPGEIPVLDDSVGILGVPIKGTQFVEVKTIFEPGIFVNQKIQLKTATVPYYNGGYKVIGIHHQGLISETVCGSATTTTTLEALDPNAVTVSQR